MRRKPLGLLVSMVIGFVLISVSHADAIPVFARKYKTTCMTCHTSPTMLNEFGLRFQSNGYQLPGTIDATPVWELDQVPIAFMLHAMWNWMETQTESTSDDTARQSTYGFPEPHGNLFSGGVLGAHFSYFTRLNVEPDGLSIDTLYFIWNNILPHSILNFRIGRFYPDVPFPQRLSLTEDIVPLVYTYSGILAPVSEAPADHAVDDHAEMATPRAPGVFSHGMRTLQAGDEHADTSATTSTIPSGTMLGRSQLGVSIFGFVPTILDGLRYEIALTNWRKEKRPDVFIRVNQTVYVNSAPFRLGILYFNGRNQFELEEMSFYEDFHRFGVDAELYDPWTKKVNVQFLWMTGKDDDAEPLESGLQERTMNGGLIGTNLFLIPEKLVVHGRFEWLNADPESWRQWVGVLRYHFTPNVFMDFMFHRAYYQRKHHAAIPEAPEDHMTHPMGVPAPGAADEMWQGESSLQTRRTSMFMVMFMFIF